MTALLNKIIASAPDHEGVRAIAERQAEADREDVAMHMRSIRLYLKELAEVERSVARHEWRQQVDAVRADLGLPSRTQESFKALTAAAEEIGTLFQTLAAPLIRLTQAFQPLAELAARDFYPEEWTLFPGLPLGALASEAELRPINPAAVQSMNQMIPGDDDA